MQPRQRWRRVALHGTRVLMFAVVVGLLYGQQARQRGARGQVSGPPLAWSQVRPLFPEAARLDPALGPRGQQRVLDASGNTLGYVLQTAPHSDQILGFSGPTNLLIACEPDERIRGLRILASGDTRDHVQQIRDDPDFLRGFRGLPWEAAAAGSHVDAVSGATLTSLAICESIAHRLGGGPRSLRFPQPPTLAETRTLFDRAAELKQDPQYAPRWRVLDVGGRPLGTLLRTAPAADNIVGYQGPSETLIGFDPQGRVTRLAVVQSYDNEPYVSYVRDDEYFLTLFQGQTAETLAALDLEQANVEGVSGATMTSQAVAEAVVRAAGDYQAARRRARRPPPGWPRVTRRDGTTLAILAAGLLLSLTRLRGRRGLRLAFQLVLIVQLGLINGDMLSQALLFGWAQNGIPWRTAVGMVALSGAALLLPIFSRRNVYCSHLCPHGAVQQLLRNRLTWKIRLPRRGLRVVALLPAALLLWSLLVTMVPLPFSLVDIEPFHAWVFRFAGWATITVAAVGLLASLVTPMAYCRFGCPTGALLGYLRDHSRSDRWTARDNLAVGLVAVAVTLFLV